LQVSQTVRLIADVPVPVPLDFDLAATFERCSVPKPDR
jgi:hypothetical protein